MHGYSTVASTPQAYRFRPRLIVLWSADIRLVNALTLQNPRYLRAVHRPAPFTAPVPFCPLSLRRVIAAEREVPHSYDVGAPVLAPTIPSFSLELALCGRPQRHRKQTTQSDGAVCLVQCSCSGSRQHRRRRHIMGPSARSFCPPIAILVYGPSHSFPHFPPTLAPFQA